MDIQLHFTEKGNGKPFILLHGNGENARYFVHQIDFFSKKYRVIAVDTRGHGLSPRGKHPFSLSQFANDLKEFFDERGIAKATILGFSDGGNIAILFALHYPQYVENLILNGANINPKGIRTWYQVPITVSYYLASFLSLFNKKFLPKKETLALMVKEPDIKLEDLQKIQAPTLVIAGTKDMVKRRHSELIANHIPNSQRQWIAGSHFIAKENWRDFYKAVSDFLSESTN